jgi:hypothetical protein
MNISEPTIWFVPKPTAAHMLSVLLAIVKYMSLLLSSGRIRPNIVDSLGDTKMAGLEDGVELAEEEVAVELEGKEEDEPVVVAVPELRLVLELSVAVADSLCVVELNTETVVELVVAWPLT